MPLPSPFNPYSGIAVAANVAAGARYRPAPTDHAVARDPHAPGRPAAPTGRLAALTAPAEKMEIHIFEEQDLLEREEGRFLTWMDAQFNPSELSETLAVVWNDIVVPGLSHERRHYSHTKSVAFKFDLAFDAFEHLEVAAPDPFEQTGITAGADFADQAQRFLHSLAYAPDGRGAPPRCLFYWPNFISLTAAVDEIAFKYTDFARSGHLLRFVASLTLREIRDARMSRMDVLVAGNRRASPPPGRAG